MPPRPDPLAVPLDATGRTVRAEVVRGPRERDGRWYWRAREEHQGQRHDVSERVLEGGRWLELRGKTGPRAVYVDPEGPAAVALRAWLAEHERLAPRWGSSSLRQVLRRACRRALVPTYTPYALRRAFAGKLRRAGMDVTERAAVMGHSAAVHLASYDRAQPEDLRAGMKGAKLEELPEGAVLAFGRRRA